MKTAVTILLAGAAVAGLVYYFRDKAPVRKVLDRSGDVLSNASDLLKEQYGRVAKKGQDAVASVS